MELYYFKKPNFGDALNPWLWPQLAPGMFAQGGDPLFIGIGTLLNQRLPTNRSKVVFGSGVGYGDPPKIDESFEIICLRGPLSAAVLGVPSELALTDPGLLVRAVPAKPAENSHVSISFMPHWESLKSTDWAAACNTYGIGFINPTHSVETIIGQIRASELLLAEAMHGAVIANAFQIPFVPVVLHDFILPFKWEDWCRSVGCTYDPIRLKPLIRHDWSLPSRIYRKIGPLLFLAGLKKRLRRSRPQVSCPKLLNELEARLLEQLELLAARNGSM